MCRPLAVMKSLCYSCVCLVPLPDSVERGQHISFVVVTAVPSYVIFSMCDECCHFLTVGSIEL